MKIESEKLLERKLTNGVKKLGGWAIKLLPFLVKGLPDRMCLFPGGHVVFVEVKTTGENATPLQRIIHRRFRNIGFRVEVIDNSQQIKDILNEFK